MDPAVIPVFILAAIAAALAGGLILAGVILGPKRTTPVKRMPYESGMDPIHDARRRFDVRFYLVAIAFLIFDVELLFLYPWAVGAYTPPIEGNPAGVEVAIVNGVVSGREMVFGGAIFFLALVALGLVYDWKKGVLKWR